MDEKINSGLAGYVFPVADPLPAVPAKVNEAALPHGFEQTPQNIAKLARELAVNIRDPKEVLKDFGLTVEQYETVVKPNPVFANALQVLIAEWNDAGNAPKRLVLQAQAILEDTMHVVGARIANKQEDLKDVVGAFKAIAGIAGMGDNRPATNPGEKFTITINLGSDTLKYDKITGRPQGAIELIEEKSDAST